MIYRNLTKAEAHRLIKAKHLLQISKQEVRLEQARDMRWRLHEHY